jgi:hypothetical protein
LPRYCGQLWSNDDVKHIIDDLSEKSKIYGNLIDADCDNPKIDQLLEDLDNIGGTPSYSFLLYIFCNLDATDEFRIEVLELLVKYFVRRMLTDTPPTRDLDPIFIELIDQYNNNQDNNIQTVINYLTQPSKYSSEELFDQKLAGNVYENNYMATRFILSKIEESESQNLEIYSNFWERNKSGIYIWTVEHIFPQGINIPKDWIKMIANGDKDLANDLRDKYAHTMGNLTLSGYNQRLSNLSFEIKRDRKDKKGNYIGYKNGLYLNRELAALDSWTTDHIEKRTSFLVSKAKALFEIIK